MVAGTSYGIHTAKLVSMKLYSMIRDALYRFLHRKPMPGKIGDSYQVPDGREPGRKRWLHTHH